jgi:hypothetical protein
MSVKYFLRFSEIEHFFVKKQGVTYGVKLRLVFALRRETIVFLMTLCPCC